MYRGHDGFYSSGERGEGSGGDRGGGDSSADRSRDYDPQRDARERGAAERLRRTGGEFDTQIDHLNNTEQNLLDGRDTLINQYNRMIDIDNDRLPSAQRYTSALNRFDTSRNLYNARVNDLQLRVTNYNNEVNGHNNRIQAERDWVSPFDASDIPAQMNGLPSYSDALTTRENLLQARAAQEWAAQEQAENMRRGPNNDGGGGGAYDANNGYSNYNGQTYQNWYGDQSGYSGGY